MAKTIVTEAGSTTLHSDHHPHLFGKTLIWNLDKDNAGKTASASGLSIGLEMEAYAIAQKINAGDVDSGMLQEMPHGQQKRFMAALEKYLAPEKKGQIEMRYNKNGPHHEFGNLTFSTKRPADTTAAPTAEDKKLQAQVAALQKKYEGNTPPQGQVLISLVEGADGKKRLLVNVHAESAKSERTPRVNLEQLMNDVKTIKADHDIDVVVGGDMNAGKKSLPGDLGAAYTDNSFNYQHSADDSAFLSLDDGTSTGIAVDAVLSTDKSTQLQTLHDMNVCDDAFIAKYNKDKTEKDALIKQDQTTAESHLKTQLMASSAFKDAQIDTGSYQFTDNRSQETQAYAIKLTFNDARQARQFNNLVGVNDRKNLLQNENEIYLTHEAITKILAADLNQAKQSVPHFPTEQLSKGKLVELQQICMEKAQTCLDQKIANPPIAEYKNSAIRQDTRGVVDYSMQLTFSTPQEARAFSDAMGYGNKTKLFQKDNKVYIAADVEADFLKKMCKVENTLDFKTRLGQTLNDSKAMKDNAMEEESLDDHTNKSLP